MKNFRFFDENWSKNLPFGSFSVGLKAVVLCKKVRFSLGAAKRVFEEAHLLQLIEEYSWLKEESQLEEKRKKLFRRKIRRFLNSQASDLLFE